MVRHGDSDPRNGVSPRRHKITEQFRVRAEKTDETAERILSGRTATGRLFVQAGDYSFPEAEWDDFVAVVLNWWVSNALALDGAVIEVDNRFMDGPFSYRVRREPGAENITITFVRNGQAELPAYVEIPYKSYLRSLYEGAEQFLDELGELSDSDIQALRRNLVQLAKLVREPGT